MSPTPMNPARLRLGLPWQLPYYGPMNGPHPLVASFLEGNPDVEPVALQAGTGSARNTDLQAVLLKMMQQSRTLSLRDGAAYIEAIQLGDQLAIESQADRCDALLLHTAPLYAGSLPWIFHFESFPSLFMPFVLTGRTRGLDLGAQGCFELVRQALESEQCLRIFSHMRGSLAILDRVFASPSIRAKLHHVPLGLPLASGDPWRAKYSGGQRLRILFTNSLHQHPTSFYLRGGHHLLRAFAQLRRSRPDAELTVLSSVPPDLLQRFAPQDLTGVNWIHHRVDEATLQQLFEQHHVFALPAAGLHSFSLLRALANGCVPIVSDAPGYEEYTRELGRSVMRVHGVRAQVYRDEAAGWISDAYDDFVQPSDDLSAQIHDALLAHADLDVLQRMAQANVEHCRRHHAPPDSFAAFRRMLKNQAPLALAA